MQEIFYDLKCFHYLFLYSLQSYYCKQFYISFSSWQFLSFRRRRTATCTCKIYLGSLFAVLSTAPIKGSLFFFGKKITGSHSSLSYLEITGKLIYCEWLFKWHRRAYRRFMCLLSECDGNLKVLKRHENKQMSFRIYFSHIQKCKIRNREFLC